MKEKLLDSIEEIVGDTKKVLNPSQANVEALHTTDMSGILQITQTVLDFEPTMHDIDDYDNEETFLIDAGGSSSLHNKDHDRAMFKRPLPTSGLQKRRFCRDKTAISKAFAFREVKKANVRVQERIDSAKRRDQEVKLCRRYRNGEIPDIMITLADVVVPMMELAKVSHLIFTKYSNIKKKSDIC